MNKKPMDVNKEKDTKFLRIDIYFKSLIVRESVSIEFREKFCSLMHEYFPNWNSISYEYKQIV